MSDQQRIQIPAELVVSICRADDEVRLWRRHIMRQTVDAVVIGGSSGALVAKVGDWLILTRWENIGSH